MCMQAILCKRKCFAAVKGIIALLKLLPTLEIPRGLTNQARKMQLRLNNNKSPLTKMFKKKLTSWKQRNDVIYYIHDEHAWAHCSSYLCSVWFSYDVIVSPTLFTSNEKSWRHCLPQLVRIEDSSCIIIVQYPIYQWQRVSLSRPTYMMWKISLINFETAMIQSNI